MLKRSRSRSPGQRVDRQPKSPRRDDRGRGGGGGGSGGGGGRDTFARQQARRNQAHEAAHMRDWVAQEDAFVLAQATRKAKIRVREGRAKPVDHLVVALGVMDPAADLLEEDSARPDFEIRDPTDLISALDERELRELRTEVESYLTLEGRSKNRRFWRAAKTVCTDRLNRMDASSLGQRGGRGAGSVAADIDKVLAPKSLEQLSQLEKTVQAKLDSNEALDEEYWEQLLASIGVFKAKAELHAAFKGIVASLYESIKTEQIAEAERARKRLALQTIGKIHAPAVTAMIAEPEPTLSIPAADKSLRVFDEADFLAKIAEDRKRARLQAPKMRQSSSGAPTATATGGLTSQLSTQLAGGNVDYSQATKALYDREAARGVQEDEEVFTGEEEVAVASKPQWAGNIRPRKPRYFNRVQMGYEWNKYNQTHYDHDNPPPKVVQGYKFNIFYPELIDKTKAPTFRIERENGRKRGQSFAPAGEEDTCLIRFIAGPPYEELAFRIVDREWDYSAKRERGFKSSFDKGILQLHFHFKKVYYRK